MAKISELLATAPADPLDGTEGFHALQDGASAGATVDQVADYVEGRGAVELLAHKSAPGGYPRLNSTGKVPRSQLPGYTDDVVEYADLASFPAIGTTGKTYIALDTNLQYRWDSGTSAYVEISGSPDSTDTIAEGSENLYFTVARVLATVLAGLSTASATVVTSAHTILEAIGFLQAQVSLKAPLASPVLTGNPTAPTQTAGNNSTRLATTAYVDAAAGGAGPASTDALAEGSTNKYFLTSRVLATVLAGLSTASATVVTSAHTILEAIGFLQAQVSLKAPLASPALTGTPTATTASASDNSTRIATTAYADAQAALAVGKPFTLTIAVSDETTALTAGAGKVTFRMPHGATLSAVRASVGTAPTGATLLAVDINEAGVSILSTKLTFDASEKTTTTAATAAVISDTSLADDAEITIDIDAVGSTVAGAGLKVTLIGVRA